MPSSRRFALLIGAALLTAGAAACGTASGSSGSSGTSGGGGKPTLSITSPANGAHVKAPFTLKFSSNQAIGPTSSGKDHVHLFLDGSTSSYQVITSSPTKVKLPAGKHTIMLTLQHADHSPIGPQAKIAVTVTAGSGSTSTGTGSGGSGSGGSGSGGSGGYGY
jgi:hypothetical protein